MVKRTAALGLTQEVEFSSELGQLLAASFVVGEAGL
jgi:hypothetical protein